jgi:hypothetical protein
MKTWGAKIIRDRMGDAEKKKLGTEWGAQVVYGAVEGGAWSCGGG